MASLYGVSKISVVQSFISEAQEPKPKEAKEPKERNETHEAIATGPLCMRCVCTVADCGPKQGPGVASSISGAGTKAAGSFHHSVSGMPWT